MQKKRLLGLLQGSLARFMLLLSPVHVQSLLILCSFQQAVSEAPEWRSGTGIWLMSQLHQDEQEPRKMHVHVHVDACPRLSA